MTSSLHCNTVKVNRIAAKYYRHYLILDLGVSKTRFTTMSAFCKAHLQTKKRKQKTLAK